MTVATRHSQFTVVDPGSEERGGAHGFRGLPPLIFFVNFSQFRGLFEVFGKNKGRWIRHWFIIIIARKQCIVLLYLGSFVMGSFVIAVRISCQNCQGKQNTMQIKLFTTSTEKQ